MEQEELEAIEDVVNRKPRKGKRPKAKFVEQREEEVKNNPLVPRNEKQKNYIRMMEDPDVGLIIATGYAGCVDADTEFLSEKGWKKISDYTSGDKVMQVSEQGLNAELVHPNNFVKVPCDSFYHFKGSRGLDQMLSHDHHIAYTVKNKEKLNKKLVIDVVEDLNKNKKLSGKFPTIYNFNGIPLNLTEADIRLGVAIKADAHLATKNTSRFVFRLKKKRKIERLFKLLEETNKEFKIYPKSEGYTVVSVYAPEHTKNLKDWFLCSKEDAEIVVDEYKYWDGDYNPVGNRLSRFSTSKREEADAMQYFFNICGYRSTVSKQTKESSFYVNGKIYNYPESVVYVVSKTKQTHLSLTPQNRKTGEILKPDKVKSKDGYKYCFEVPSSFLVLRRNGNVFITGNTSKTYIPTVIACDLLRTKKIERIIFTRPNISNSKSLGMFKGTMVEKISLWLMPVMNILRERLGENTLELYIKRRQIDFVPMEVVKGYSAENCVFICDEAEDLSLDEAKKIVTRQGENCKMVLAGDISQSELKDKSGLKLLLDMTKRHDTLKVGVVDFNNIGDIVRSDQCKNWIIAFRKDESKNI